MTDFSKMMTSLRCALTELTHFSNIHAYPGGMISSEIALSIAHLEEAVDAGERMMLDSHHAELERLHAALERIRDGAPNGREIASDALGKLSVK